MPHPFATAATIKRGITTPKKMLSLRLAALPRNIYRGITSDTGSRVTSSGIETSPPSGAMRQAEHRSVDVTSSRMQFRRPRYLSGATWTRRYQRWRGMASPRAGWLWRWRRKGRRKLETSMPRGTRRNDPRCRWEFFNRIFEGFFFILSMGNAL